MQHKFFFKQNNVLNDTKKADWVCHSNQPPL